MRLRAASGEDGTRGLGSGLRAASGEDGTRVKRREGTARGDPVALLFRAFARGKFKAQLPRLSLQIHRQMRLERAAGLLGDKPLQNPVFPSDNNCRISSGAIIRCRIRRENEKSHADPSPAERSQT